MSAASPSTVAAGQISATALRLPDFFIIGAPKCGTTALQAYLDQAPDVFMPEGKEFHHFADDLLPSDDPLRDRAAYAEMFADATATQRIGEASVFHMLSETAAENIAKACPNAAIVAMVRNPIEVLPSLHSQLLFNGSELHTDFDRALDAEAERSEGRGSWGPVRFPQMLLYSRVVRFAEQLERYLERFENVHVVLHDDLRADTAGSYRVVADFLQLDPKFTPEFPIVNANKQRRSRLAQRLLDNPDGPARLLAPLVPSGLRRAARRLLSSLNTTHTSRSPLTSPQRQRLLDICGPEIERLGALLERDLSHWIDLALPATP